MNTDGMITANMNVMKHMTTTTASFGVSVMGKAGGSAFQQKTGGPEAQWLHLLLVRYCGQITYATRSMRKKHYQRNGKTLVVRIITIVYVSNMPCSTLDHSVYSSE